MSGLASGLLVSTVLVAACASKPRPPAPPAPPVISDDQSATSPDGGAAPASDPGWTNPPASAPADDRPVVVSKDELVLCADADKQIKTFDLSGDGRADVWKLHNGEAAAGTLVLTCKKVDLDFNGQVDMMVGYLADGTVLFEQFDLTFDGQFDVVKRYDPATKLEIETARDSDSDGAYDVFESYQDGQLILVARDRNGDSAIDAWEIYEDGALVERQLDDNYDGIVDRSE
jgi:hypothetical protein